MYMVLLADLVDPPHPDILSELCQTIGAKYPEHEPYHPAVDLCIRWRGSGGFGKSHQAWFYIDLAIFRLKYEVLTSWSSSKTHRITFTFANPHVIDALLDDHPVIKRHALTAHCPWFIQPYYVLEITVPGCSVY